MRSPLLAANWKMNKTIGDALAFAGAFIPEMLDVMGLRTRVAVGASDAKGYGAEAGDQAPWPEILVCPPFTAIPALSAAMAGYPVAIGAQDVFWQDKGAFTGEISPAMLKDAGCSYVIVGHSERRHVLDESDEWVRKKLRAALDHGLKPILCVGETLQEREAGQTYKVCETMAREGMRSVKKEEVSSVVLAYEPVWAIGTGKEAKPEDAGDVIARLRATVDSMFGEGASVQVRVLYGGSVKPGNIRSFIAHPEIDGALVGGASLDPIEFAKLALEIRKGRPRG